MKPIKDLVLKEFFLTQLLIVSEGTIACTVAVTVFSLLLESFVPLLLLLPLIAVWAHLISMYLRLARYGVQELWRIERGMLDAWLMLNASVTYPAS